MARSILIVTQHAPPSPLVGARRPAALAKELSRLALRLGIFWNRLADRRQSARSPMTER